MNMPIQTDIDGGWNHFTNLDILWFSKHRYSKHLSKSLGSVFSELYLVTKSFVFVRMKIGYARISKSNGEQNLDLQLDALKKDRVKAKNIIKSKRAYF